MYVWLKPGFAPSPEIEAKVRDAIVKDMKKIARPNIWIVPDMPKTRSGKIMRRVIAATSNFTDTGDITTLANPEIVEKIRHQVQSAKHAKGEVPRELSEAELNEMQVIVEEAGGVFTDLTGKPTPDGGSVVCTNRRLHGEVLDFLARR